MQDIEATLRPVRARVIAVALLFTLAAMLLFILRADSNWRTACVLFLGKDFIYVVYAIRYRDRWVQRLLLFLAILTAFNFFEDWLLVSWLRVTHYDLPESHPPTLWHTPIFGLIAWPAMTMELAIFGAWLVGRWRWLGILSCCVLGILMIPVYDELALHLHWWRYESGRLFMHTPYFVIMAESLLAGAIGWAAFALQHKERSPRVLGVIIGLYLLVATYLSHLALG